MTTNFGTVIRKTAIVTAIGFAFAAIAAISPASAGGNHQDRRHAHKGSGHHQEQTYKRGHHQTQDRTARQVGRIINHLIGGYSRPNRHLRHDRPNHRWRHRRPARHVYRSRSCHPVYKYRLDRWGNDVKVRGTMCYDRRGNGYIVRGSRRIVDHY